MRNKKSILLIILFCTAVFVFTKCINGASAGVDPRGKEYAGAKACRQCHQAMYDSFIGTAHFTSTAIAGKNNIHGDFTSPHNTFNYINGAQVKMEKRNDDFYQVIYVQGKEQAAFKFDVVFGGKNAQTFLYWKGNQTFELPVSYYNSVKAWATSPGFPIQQPVFDRFIGASCFECHSSSMEVNADMNASGISEEYVPGTLTYGIDCERCHGPAAAHVDYHIEHPGEKTARFLISNSALSRQQRTDACAVCHGGNDQAKLISRFKFRPGDTLSNFFMPFVKKQNFTEFDVHGNQSQLLAQSKCFRGTAELTCTTCHSPHTDAGTSVQVYSQKCMTCHDPAKPEFCPKLAIMGESIKNNCIDCHMPKQSSKAITFFQSESEKKSAYMLHNHRIAIYDTAVSKKSL